MDGVDVLIFSRDRPAQLELLLRSIDVYAPDLYSSVSVLWTCTGLDFGRGYARLQAESARSIRWGRERDFERDVRDWLYQAGETVSFLVDDDVFYRPAPAPERLPWSFRGGDYDYPFSVDGNVYEKADVAYLLHGLHFDDPTQLEAGGHELRRRLPFASVEPCGAPCLVGVPANRVSPSSGMPHMGVSPAVLNDRFLAGDRLELPAVAGDLPAHAELELVFA